MLIPNLDLLATAPSGVARLRELILTLAVQGKLMPQDPDDEPAIELLKKIRTEKDRLIAAKALKREKDEPALTGDAPPFDLPESWIWVALGEVIDIVRGITFPATQKTREAAPGRIACLRTTNVQQTIEWDDLLFVDRSFMGREDQLIQHHDIVMSMANSRELVGKVALIDKIPHAEATFGGFLGVLRPRIIEPRYAMAVLRTPYARALLIDSSSQTTNIANVSLAKLRPMAFPLPPLAEQSRIITRVEELMRLCDALEAKSRLEAKQHALLVSTLLGTLIDSETPEELAENWQRIATHFDLLIDRPEAVDALEQTILQLAVRGLLVPQDPKDEPASELLKKIRTEKDKLITEGKIKRDKPLPPIAETSIPCTLPFGWAWMRFSEIGDFRGGKTPSTQRSTYWGGDIPWITPKDMKQSLLSDSEDKVTLSAVDDGLALIPSQSVLIVVRSGILRRTLPTAINSVETTINQDLKALVLVRPSTAGYVQLLIRGFEGFILKNLTKVGTTVESVQFDAFAAQPFPIPPIAEQSRIVARVAHLSGLCADLRQRLTSARQRQSQLAQALVGELTTDNG